MARILVADDEKSIRVVLRKLLTSRGYDVLEAKDGREALEILRSEPLELAFLDIKMPFVSGLELVEEAKERGVVPVILTAFGTMDYTVKAMELGAAEYITKPFSLEEVLKVVEELVERERPPESSWGEDVGEKIVGSSKRMQEVFKLIGKVAKSSITVLITGESGSGKELVARAIHDYSDRKDKPFITVNCAALPPNLLEAELFGYEKGAFTGAITSKRGLFEQADGGTLFLDEIGELPLELQAKLLRVLQDKEVRRLGSERVRKVNTRIIAATNKDLKEEVKRGKFREDLFFRLDVVRIELPPLRERREDIVPLAKHFIKKFSTELKLEPKELSEGAVKFLLSYDFPGNVRELENMILRAMVLSSSPYITERELRREEEKTSLEEIIRGVVQNLFSVERKGESDNLYELVMRSTEKVLIEEVLKLCNFNQSKAAKVLGIHRNTLRRKLRELNIDRSERNNF